MQARSERTRRRLVRAGAQMFNRSGYASATLGQIAAAAGLTKGALYFHFASKDGLADAVQEQAHTVLRDFVRRQWAAGVPPVQALIDMTHWLAWALHEDPVIRASFRITNECVGRQPPVTDFHQAWIVEVLRLIDRAREAGALREHTSADGPETLLSAAVCGIGVLSGTGMPYPELRRRVGALWDSLLTALVPAGHTGRYDVRASALTTGFAGAV
ncbi:ScbR family autoregulator-binding transcription factor [Streptomyces sp. S.PB5]|uniref:ScbR family autoregulator-binding transcription factor n=1 Tax=Streptomyces sp. S.PB5 TaxID=3020844 RepID=UPI0025B134BD|nr:ScbR family autoregulator-binding transcription factor [Streptomyces sp. S.PB5]MDN3027288.1 ScbR family autoregulator-binding transcription factor [Streptomyces sp. S.PB5]